MEVKDEIQAVILVYFMCLLEQYWWRYLGLKFWHFANNLFVWRICCGGATAVGDIRFEREKELSQRTEAEAASRGRAQLAVQHENGIA